MICKDCIHEELCVYEDEATSECSDFKDKTQVVEVVRCKDCIIHDKCSTEDVFIFTGVENPFCCAGKKVE